MKMNENRQRLLLGIYLAGKRQNSMLDITYKVKENLFDLEYLESAGFVNIIQGQENKISLTKKAVDLIDPAWDRIDEIKEGVKNIVDTIEYQVKYLLGEVQDDE